VKNAKVNNVKVFVTTVKSFIIEASGVKLNDKKSKNKKLFKTKDVSNVIFLSKLLIIVTSVDGEASLNFKLYSF
jgi:hypothetical protein